MKKAIIAILFLMILAASFTALKLFVIGEPVDGDALWYEVEDAGEQINIFVGTPASAIAFSDVNLHQKGTALYITIRKVLVSPLFDSGTHNIWIEKNDLTEIWLGSKLIWSEE